MFRIKKHASKILDLLMNVEMFDLELSYDNEDIDCDKKYRLINKSATQIQSRSW
jgi:hypothetical protein